MIGFRQRELLSRLWATFAPAGGERWEKRFEPSVPNGKSWNERKPNMKRFRSPPSVSDQS